MHHNHGWTIVRYSCFGLRTRRVAQIISHDWYCPHVVASLQLQMQRPSSGIAPTRRGPKTLSLIVTCTAVPAWLSMQLVANAAGC